MLGRQEGTLRALPEGLPDKVDRSGIAVNPGHRRRKNGPIDSCILRDTLRLVPLKRVVPRQIEEYLTPDGVSPFHDWVRGLKDAKTRAVIRQRLDRVMMGNLGEWAPVGEGVSELKIDYGPGYRIYFGEDGQTLVILLCAGNKSTQRADIRKARAYWQEYRRVGHAEANQEI